MGILGNLLYKCSQAFFPDSNGNLGLVSRHCRGKVPHFSLMEILWVFLELQWEVEVPLGLRQGPQGSSHVASGKSGLL